jgi:hypothetical protein
VPAVRRGARALAQHVLLFHHCGPFRSSASPRQRPGVDEVLGDVTQLGVGVLGVALQDGERGRRGQLSGANG